MHSGSRARRFGVKSHLCLNPTTLQSQTFVKHIRKSNQPYALQTRANRPVWDRGPAITPASPKP